MNYRDVIAAPRPTAVDIRTTVARNARAARRARAWEARQALALGILLGFCVASILCAVAVALVARQLGV